LSNSTHSRDLPVWLKELGVTEEEWCLSEGARQKGDPNLISAEEHRALFKVAWEVEKRLDRQAYEGREEADRLQDHVQFRTLLGAYGATLTAVCIAILSTGKTDGAASWAVSFMTLSLPWICGAVILDYKMRLKQRRPRSRVLTFMTYAGLSLSMVGILSVVSMFSWLTALLLLVSVVLVFLLVREANILGGGTGFEDF
jgi:hypothetical protein